MNDPFASGKARGWRVFDASNFERDARYEADVAIVGTGAGGGTAAEILSRAGLRVVLIEEGPLRSSSDFALLERVAYPNLYQESAARKTKDKGINILQGRCVGGSTTVNWTTSFRTPSSTLAFWRERFGLSDYRDDLLAPWFAHMERRLHIAPWSLPPNANNDALLRGAQQLGIPAGVIARNVESCRNLGYCGFGCPVNAKQSMLVTTIPAALDRGAVLLSRTRAERFVTRGDRVVELQCAAMDARGIAPSGRTVGVRARHYVTAAGAIGSPALLLRSALPDPFHRVGKRTFLHPTLISAAIMPDPVMGFSGAPQSVYSDHFLSVDPIDGPVGFKLEVPPLHPVLSSTTFTGLGEMHARLMSQFSHAHAMLALLRDGFHEESPGGTVSLKSDGTPLLDYALTPYLWEGARRALLAMAELQFAAGAHTVLPLHEDAAPYATLDEARAAISHLPMEVLRTRVASAHVMGGCTMGSDPTQSVVDGFGRHHALENLSVFDGSIFPTSLGANPQLSIYGITARNVTRLATSLGGKVENDDLISLAMIGPETPPVIGEGARL
ncbi:MAG: GMC family oxidoreductase [Candidatus Eremiobacteraeota bacterium]|nr:GMC family oxidoreductase [Candidatus Eremiobacteraeota bacterium]